jgi:hypothetical protein
MRMEARCKNVVSGQETLAEHLLHKPHVDEPDIDLGFLRFKSGD